MLSSLWEFVPDTWQDELSPVQQTLSELDQLLEAAADSGDQIVPIQELIFNSLQTGPSQVRIVILGQDPYPNSAHAIGLAFAVPAATSPLPSSLRNIFKEVDSDLGTAAQSSPDLKSWASQGVLLLNTSLTTTHGQSAAHATWPWSPVVNQILKSVTEHNPNVVAILWGRAARNYSHLFNPERIISSAHPSPLSAHRGFFGSKPFSGANAMLAVDGHQVINW